MNIPEDILCHIFQLTLPVWDSPDSHTLNDLKEPWTLSAVCSFWRSTALAQKSLWAHIRVDCRLMPNRVMLFKQVLFKVKLALERSDPAPLSVYYMGYSAAGYKADQEDFIQALWRSSSRWVRLHTDTLPGGTYGELPLLEQLFYQTPHYVTHRILPATFGNAPRLKQVALRSYGHDPLDLMLPLHQIEVLDIIMQGRHYLPAQILCKMPALVSFTYSCPHGREGDFYVVHQQLNSLTTDSLGTFMMIHFPQLRSLTLDNPPHPRVRTTPITMVLKFVHQNEFMLTSLSLGRVEYDDKSSLFDLFHALPHLIRLQIIERHSWSESFWNQSNPLVAEDNDWRVPWRIIFSALRRTDSNDVLPRLTTLDLQTRQTTFLMDGMMDLLLQMLTSRVSNHPMDTRIICLSQHPTSFHSRREVPTTLVDELTEAARSSAGLLEATAGMVLVPSYSSRKSPYYDPLGLSCDSGREKWLLEIFTRARDSPNDDEGTLNVFLPPMINW